MSTSLPLQSSSLQIETMSREVRVHPESEPSARWVREDRGTEAAVQSTIKRLIDVVGAMVCLFSLLPLMLLIGLLVRLSSPGPALFRQLRQGRGGRTFWFLKFRTMTADAEHRLRDLE